MQPFWIVLTFIYVLGTGKHRSDDDVDDVDDDNDDDDDSEVRIAAEDHGDEEVGDNDSLAGS